MTDIKPSVELKPCPFCGGEAYLANVDMVGCSYVVCTDCRTQSDDMSKSRAISAWNTRAEPTQPDPLGAAWMREQAAEGVWSAHDDKDAAYWGFSPSDIARRERATAIRAIPDPKPADQLVQALKLPEVRAALEASYLAGFNSSGEGYNGEYPFQDSTEDPEKDADWLAARSAALAALVQP